MDACQRQHEDLVNRESFNVILKQRSSAGDSGHQTSLWRAVQIKRSGSVKGSIWPVTSRSLLAAEAWGEARQVRGAGARQEHTSRLVTSCARWFHRNSSLFMRGAFYH